MKFVTHSLVLACHAGITVGLFTKRVQGTHAIISMSAKVTTSNNKNGTDHRTAQSAEQHGAGASCLESAALLTKHKVREAALLMALCTQPDAPQSPHGIASHLLHLPFHCTCSCHISPCPCTVVSIGTWATWYCNMQGSCMFARGMPR